MGTRYTFECNKCNYNVESSGETSSGMHYVVSPYICNDCKIITDVAVGMFGICYLKQAFDNPKENELPDFIIESKNEFYKCEKCEGDNISDWDSESGECPKCSGKMEIDEDSPTVLWD